MSHTKMAGSAEGEGPKRGWKKLSSVTDKHRSTVAEKGQEGIFGL